MHWSFSQDGQGQMRPPSGSGSGSHQGTAMRISGFSLLRSLALPPLGSSCRSQVGANRVTKAALRTRGRAAAARTAVAAAGAAQPPLPGRPAA